MNAILNFFPGFYESLLTFQMEMHIESEMEYDESYEMDYPSVKVSMSEKWLENLEHEIGIKMKFVKIHPPKCYNYSTDTLEVGVDESDIEKIYHDCIFGNLTDVFDELLRDTFTARSGFCPFYSNDSEEWDKPLSDYDEIELGILIEAKFRSECVSGDVLCEDMQDCFFY